MWYPSHIQGWKICTLYDPATGDRVQINDIDHNISGLGFEEILNEVSSSKSQSGWDVMFNIGSTDTTGVAQIEQWVEHKTPLNAVVAGDKNVQWYEGVPLINYKRAPEADRRSGDERWSASLSFAGGYNMQIYNNVNLLHQTNVAGKKVTGFVDNDGDEIADNLVFASGNSVNFDNGIQTILCSAAGNAYTYIKSSLVFPVVGIDLNFSFKIISQDENTLTRFSLADFFNSTISISDKTITNIGTSSHSIETITGFYKTKVPDVYCGRMVGKPEDSEVSYNELSLRTDGSPKYIAG